MSKWTPEKQEELRRYQNPAPVEMKNESGVKWHRLKYESRVAYEAFSAFRDLGPARSLRKTAEKVGKSHSLMNRWSSRWHWFDRVDAFDAEEAYELTMRTREARMKMRETDAETARTVKEKVIERIQKIKPSELSPTQVITWWETAVKIERLSLGDVTDNVQQTIADKRDDLGEAIAANPDLANELAEILENARDSSQ